jgi:hypothetical protein
LHHQDLDRKKEIEQAEEELKKFIETHEIVKDNLKLFMEPKGLTELDIQKWSEASKYKQKYEDLKKDLHLARQGKALDPNEVKKLNDKLQLQLVKKKYWINSKKLECICPPIIACSGNPYQIQKS